MEEPIQKISTELSLWKPQKLALRIFANIINLFDPKKDDLKTIEAVTQKKFDTIFPSFTFDMATGSGKTRVMAASISYLYKKGLSKNFFILAPGEIIYNKLIDDFSKSSHKFQLQGWTDIPEFEVVTGENYERYNPDQTKIAEEKFTIFIFNIQKFRRKDKTSLKFHSFKEKLGSSFSDIISELSDLVLLMDESHHYRAELTKESIADLKPLLGLEFSATPSYTKNIIYSYSLGDAVNDYIVKRLEAVVRKDDRSFNEELDELKLIEGLKIHEKKKTWIEEYCKNYEVEILKPLTFISTKNIAHGDEIQKKIESDKFMEGKYKDKTVYVHSGSEDAQVKQLLTLEEPDNEKEIVIHVNKLKEGWDVKNIFTIIPLRASISTTLTEQTIGRGVRLPFPDATNDHIENFPKAFTLHIITFSGKDDNYKDVIEKSKKNNIIVKNYDDEIFKEKNIETYEIKPSTKTKHVIPIPVFKGSVKQVDDLHIFEIKPNYEELRKDVQAKVEAIDLVKQKTYDLGKAVETTEEDLVKFLINRLIENTNEIGYDDKPVVSKIVEKYLNKAVKSKNKKEWEKYLRKHASTIFDDIQNQISSQVQNTIKIKHSFDKKNWKFEPYFVSKEKEKPLVDKNNFSDEKISNVFKGYERCVYSEMKFDSKQEKLLADILDEDKQVSRWLKNPVSKYGIPIKYKFGNYYLDFFVETEKKLYALEVKSSKDIREPTVIEKGKEAKKWCEKISKVSKKPWKYGIVPHDQIKRKDSFNRVISNIVTF